MLSDEELQSVYLWIDSIPLSRPKRNIARDFSDGVLLAEVVHHYFPKYVELHNYSSANSVRQKLYNWSTLNQKVFKRLDFEVKKSDVEAIVNCKPGIIELILLQTQQKISDLRARRAAGELSPVAAGTAEPVSGGMGASMSSYSAGEPSLARSLHLSAAGAAAGAAADADAATADELAEKDAALAELRETVEIQELKIRKLEQLVKLKDQRIQALTARLTPA